MPVKFARRFPASCAGRPLVVRWKTPPTKNETAAANVLSNPNQRAHTGHGPFLPLGCFPTVEYTKVRHEIRCSQ